MRYLPTSLTALGLAAVTCLGTLQAPASASTQSAASLSTSSTSVARSAVPTSEQNDNYVSWLYWDFLGREADPAGLAGWSDALTSGALTRLQVTKGLAGSDEFHDDTVSALYALLLDRSPAPQERAAWKAALRRGVTFEQVVIAFYSSDEFYARLESDSAWVAGLYLFLLGREPELAEIAAWRPLIAQVGRAGVVRGINSSPERLTLRVRSQYLVVLGREPDPSGLATFTPFVATYGDVALAATLASSDEYFAAAQEAEAESELPAAPEATARFAPAPAAEPAPQPRAGILSSAVAVPGATL
jgi:hypothetical protein